MSEPILERACPIDPALALARAVGWFTRNGYQLVQLTPTFAELLYVAGAEVATRLELGHRMTVSADGKRLTFELEPGMDISQWLTPREEVERECELATLAALRAETPPRTFCSTCATPADRGATCSLCGTTVT